MRIARFISDDGTIQTGELLKDDTARVVKGDFSTGFEPTRFTARVKKLLAPLVPTDILCIGINYREHAAESNSAIPQNPMLFIKASGTLNHPGDPIPDPASVEHDRLRRRARRRHRPRGEERPARSRARSRLRLLHRQRRLRARLASARRN
jgi:hypothetical protein